MQQYMYSNRTQYHCLRLQTVFLLFTFVMSGTKESFVTRTSAVLVGTLISIGDVSVNIHIQLNGKTN